MADGAHAQQSVGIPLTGCKKGDMGITDGDKGIQLLESIKKLILFL